ncbi:MAG: transcriptional regulator, TraR/DksA family [Ramlibacter sp.]|nr:transcriptional regulator, TraR/DksA family [Ramlibacter sp.]
MNTYHSGLTAQFDALLAGREQELCAVLHTREAQADTGEARSDVIDFKDIAIEDTLAVVDEVQAENAAHELEQVLAARRRLQDHRYGACLDCGEAIDLRRLAAMPATPFCTGCQAVHEQEHAALARH